MRARLARALVVLTVPSLFVAAIALAQKPPPKPPVRPPARTAKDAGVVAREAGAAGTTAATIAAPQPTANADAGVLEAKTLDGGTRVFKFGEVEIEGRLRSPQIVYFLRRVRAEFAAGDLGHRSFMGELSDTRRTPNF
ncbi:hypothetical protein BH09MYX1_BH09MYX1_19130 [soil metagenome]